MASTQLQKFGARRLFPCIDEPKHKAKFYVTVNKLKNYEAISNTNPISDPVEIL